MKPEKQAQMDIDRNWINADIKNKQVAGFYGTVTIIFEAGLVKRVRDETSKVPPKAKCPKRL